MSRTNLAAGKNTVAVSAHRLTPATNGTEDNRPKGLNKERCKMTYDNEFLAGNKACEEGYKWAQTQTDRSHEAFLRAAAEENFGYFTWCLTHTFNAPQSVEFAVFCAELVLPIFERKFPADERPRKAIAAAAADAAYAASRAAADEAYAAAYEAEEAEEADEARAAYAAYAAADVALAADAAARAADAAADAARAAAADDAAYAETKQKIVEKAVEILNCEV